MPPTKAEKKITAKVREATAARSSRSEAGGDSDRPEPPSRHALQLLKGCGGKRTALSIGSLGQMRDSYQAGSRVRPALARSIPTGVRQSVNLEYMARTISVALTALLPL